MQRRPVFRRRKSPTETVPRRWGRPGSAVEPRATLGRDPFMPTWFLYLNGVALMILGVALLRTRPRQPGDSIYRRYVNLGTLWACLCVAVGGLLFASAAGYWSWERESPPPAPTTTPWRETPGSGSPGR